MGGQHCGGEQFVVTVGQASGTGRFGPHPFGEAVAERLLLVACREGLGVVADPAPIVGGISDGVEPLVERSIWVDRLIGP